MNQFDDWHRRIREAKIDGVLQAEIANKILELLRQKKDSASAAEIWMFAQAITGLSMNVNSDYQPTEAGLIKCLKSLRKAVATTDQTDKFNECSDDISELFSYGRLVATVEDIKSQIT